jgi:hypothetical protein
MFRVGSAYPRSIVEATPLRSRAWSAALALAIVLLAGPARAGGQFLAQLEGGALLAAGAFHPDAGP